MTHTNLERLESGRYQDSLSDGLIDLSMGFSLAWIGTIWLWIESLPGLAGIGAVVITWTLISIRARIHEERLGYVRWRAPRLQWQSRQIILWAALLMVAFLLGNGVMFALENGDTLESQGIVPGLPAFVVGVGAFAWAAKTRIGRVWVYGAVLVATAVLTVVAEANPGWSLLVSGVIISSVGAALLVGFLQTHPVRNLE